MSKIVLFLCLILLNLKQFRTQFVVLDEDLTETKALDSTKYLKLLSKVTENQNKTSSQHLNSLSERVQTFRRFLSPSKEPPTEKCQYVVLYFGLILSQFVECVLINEVPFGICLGCSQQYSDLFNAFTDLKNSSVSNCSNTFLNDDKIQSINHFFQNSISEWTDDDCDSCFNGTDINRNFMVNNDTQYYFGLTENYVNCLNQSLGVNDSCILCKESFHSVNDYYELLSVNYSSHVCNDIIVSMKDIRKYWSDSLKCPIDTTSSLHFLALVFLIIVLPFVLYIIGRLFCGVNSNKTLLKQKRLSTYHLGSYETEPLVQ